MRLKRLELQGFKSFVDKTEISFEDGITAVVGPNGSGKSNVSDAIRWVLGEQSAKTLRGSKMGDVIFAGTEKRNAVGFCRVDLVFENDDRWLNVDHSEVSVSRKYYKSGESEYYINNSQCRLKDILELFRDTGVGKEGYSIIGQGQVTDILSNSGAERRMAFEAATGILKYKSRKSDAQSRLLKTGENIDRLNDLLDEINANVEYLEEQSKQAKEYLVYKDKLKEYELARFIYKTDQNEKKALELEKESKIIDNRISNETSRREQLKSEKNTILEEIRIETEKEQSLRDEHLKLREEILKSGSKTEVTFERLKAVNENLDILMQQDEAIKKDIDGLTLQLEQDKAILNDMLVKLSENESEQRVKADAHEKLKADMVENQQKLDDLKQQRILFLNSVSEIKINASKYNAMLESIQNRLLDIDGLKNTSNCKIEKLASEKEALDGRIKEMLAQKDELEEKKHSLIDEQATLEKEKLEAINTAHNDEVKMGAIKSKLNLLKNMQKEYEGYNYAIKNLFKISEKDIRVKSKILGTVADIVEVKKEYVVAIETALGASLQNIVTNTEEDAKELIRVLKSNNMGRATFLPISGVRPSYLNKEEQASMSSIDGVIGCGVELVDFEEKYNTVVQKLLGRTVVVDNLDTAIKLMRKNAFRFQTVTLGGEIIHAGGAMSGGSKSNKSAGILGRNDEILELEKIVKNMEDRAASYEGRLATFDSKIKGLQERITDNKTELKYLYNNLDELQNEISILAVQIDGETEKIVALNEEKEQLSDNRLDIEDKLKIVSDSDAKPDFYVDESEIENLSLIVNSLREKNEISHEELSAIYGQISGLKRDVENLEKNIERSSRELESKKQQLIIDGDLVIKYQNELNELNKAVDEYSQSNKESAAAEESLKIDIEEKSKAIYLLQTKLEENESATESCTENISADTDRRYKIDIEKNKISVETEMLDNDIFERYDLTYDDVLKIELGVEAALYKHEIDEIREKIKSMGNVNLNSIDEYAYAHTRHEQITAQLNDLLESKKDLEDLICVLQKDMTAQFNEQFKLINMNFERIFKSLFGGGKAELVLEKNESVLECDIEIAAQPPGKKVQNISQLSGGERTLIAIAILFAMLELKPTPFCVLDEIDAALDESNVHRFATYLNNYSGKTQFLVITHKRGVMELSDAIYGVAMQEKGVSKVVSIKIPD